MTSRYSYIYGKIGQCWIESEGKAWNRNRTKSRNMPISCAWKNNTAAEYGIVTSLWQINKQLQIL